MIIKLPSSNSIRFIGYIGWRFPRVIIGSLQRIAILAYIDQVVAAKNQSKLNKGSN